MVEVRLLVCAHAKDDGGGHRVFKTILSHKSFDCFCVRMLPPLLQSSPARFVLRVTQTSETL